VPVSFRLVATPIAPVRPPDPPAAGGLPPALRAAFLPVGDADRLLARLADPTALAVTTGQQPGLFGGPLYTMHKAMSAAALAAELEAAWGRPVVPVFWLAGDDHDLAEAAEAAWLDEEGGLVRHVLRRRPAGAPLTPMFREPLGRDGAEAVAALERTLRSGPHREAMVDWARRHWRPEATVAGAFASGIAELLAPFGILCFDSTSVAAKRAMAPLLLEAAGRAGELDAALARRAGALREAGADPGVAVGDGAALVLLEGRDGRDRLVPGAAGWTLRRSGERFDRGALEGVAAAEPTRLSPNVLLRPVVERALLPTVAYVAGPGELRYLPLAAPLYDRLGLVPQRPVPRWSGLVVEAQADRVAAKFGATLEELMADGAALERRVVRDDLPEAARRALDRLRETSGREFGTLAEVAAEVDPTLVRSLGGLARRTGWAVDRAERKLVAHLLRRRAVELAQVGRARTGLRPGGAPQERVLGFPAFGARHGGTLPSAVRDAARTGYAAALVAAPARS
jgi:bacillithiol biosynthesis cysteine-adding enzyme BshC